MPNPQYIEFPVFKVFVIVIYMRILKVIVFFKKVNRS